MSSGLAMIAPLRPVSRGTPAWCRLRATDRTCRRARSGTRETGFILTLYFKVLSSAEWRGIRETVPGQDEDRIRDVLADGVTATVWRSGVPGARRRRWRDSGGT